MSKPGQGHLEERQQQITKSALAVTAEEPGLGVASATFRLGDLGPVPRAIMSLSQKGRPLHSVPVLLSPLTVS